MILFVNFSSETMNLKWNSCDMLVRHDKLQNILKLIINIKAKIIESNQYSGLSKKGDTCKIFEKV